MRQYPNGSKFENDASAEKMSNDLFSKLDRATLVSESGTAYAQVQRRLTPRWGVVWRDLTLGWLGLALIILGTIAVSHRSPGLALTAAAVGAILVGFTIAYLMLFQHEAAHYNIHPNQRWNDLLSNLFVGGIAGMDVQTYRQIHWDHHRHFGGPMDSEISYRDPLNLRLLVESLIGVRTLRVVLMRERLRGVDTGKPAKSRLKTQFYALLGGMAFNTGCLGGLLYLH
jgi:fatty acid desaturase